MFGYVISDNCFNSIVNFPILGRKSAYKTKALFHTFTNAVRHEQNVGIKRPGSRQLHKGFFPPELLWIHKTGILLKSVPSFIFMIGKPGTKGR